ncbi:MAG: endolytic transglycosylase MltG [bacterium]
MNNKKIIVKKKISLLNFPVIIAILICAILVSLFLSLIIPISFDKKQLKEVSITYGTGLRKISNMLASNGFIRNSLAFEIYALATGSNKKFQAGEYEFSAGESALDIANKLVKGDVKKHQIVVPEGSDIGDIDRILSDAGMIKSGDVLKAVADKSLLKAMGIDNQSAEGLLFPDTYFIVRGETAEKILQTMHERFIEKTVIDINRVYDIQGYKATGYKVLIMASIIEKESRLDVERFLVSSVFYNRLKSPEAYQKRLESCATVRYALNKKKGIITYKDLRVENPYNTYIRIGLPPGPICNPGIPSMTAALKPAVTKYRYFVLYENGEHTFSETLEQHNIAKIKNKRIRQGQE